MPLKERFSQILTKDNLQILLIVAFTIAMIFAMHPGTRFWQGI